MNVWKTLKASMPPAFRRYVQTWKRERSIKQFETRWQEIIGHSAALPVERPIRRILVVPPDPGTLMGALGDDAMITSTLEMAREYNPDVEIDALTSTPMATELARSLGLRPVQIWESPNLLDQFVALLKERHFDAVVAMGADIMDGYHDYFSSLKVIALMDTAARAGIPSTVLGFSFNAQPNPRLAPHLACVNRAVRFCLRDEISYNRFVNFTKATAELVADSAFVLRPQEADPAIMGWIAGRRALGDLVIGVNVHPMLFSRATEEQVRGIVARCVEAIEDCSRARKISWLLLPHDYRGELGDGVCLEPAYEQLSPVLEASVHYLEGRHRAAQLKTIAGALDGVVTGRMHLAIATLGMGVPTQCVTYQDKFEGLYRHADLPDWLLLAPTDYLREDVFKERLSRFIDQLDELRQVVMGKKQRLLDLSRQNFSVFG